MTAIFIVLLITLAIYSAFGMLFYESYAPPFLAVAIVCLFLALKQVLAEVRALYELLHMELDDIKEKLSSESTEETDKAEEPKSSDETNLRIKLKLRRLAFAFVGADFLFIGFRLYRCPFSALSSRLLELSGRYSHMQDRF